MRGDPLGGLRLSHSGVILRDEFVFRTAFEKKTSICMVLSGGY